MLGYSSLFVKKTNTFFRAHFQIQNCFETARVVWGAQTYVFSLYPFSLNQNKNYKLGLYSMSVMIQAIICLLNTFTFILVQFSCSTTVMRQFSCSTTVMRQFSCSTTVMRSWTLPLNQIIAIIAFHSHLKKVNVFLSFINI